MIQDPSRLILDFDIVDHVLPREYGGLSLDDSDFRLSWSLAVFLLITRFGILRFNVFLDVRCVRNLSSWEQKDLSLGLSGGDVLYTRQSQILCTKPLRTGSQKMPAQKSKHESDQDTDISPFVCCFINVGRVDISLSRDDIASRYRADRVADLISGRDRSISGTRGNNVTAVEGAAAELVDHCCLEAIRNWIQVIDPSRPA